MMAVIGSNVGAGRHSPVNAVVNTIRSSGTISRNAPVIGVCPPLGSPISRSKAPPGRTSKPTILVVMGFGHHHFSRCSGTVHAFHTTRRGALMIRDTVKSYL